nr:retrovirus-related Pol polyprotein from transposon TNT 1-94 [Tanacetum cinerariifolium]
MAIQGGRIQKANKKSFNAKGKGKGKGKGNDKSYILKPKNPKPSTKEHSTKDDTCYHYKEVGHYKRNYPAYLAELIKKNMCERWKRTLLDIVRSMMNLITLPLSFWDYDLETAIHILNMVSTKKVDKTPYELCGRAVELEEIQDEDTSPSENTSEIPMEVEGFEPPQEEVVPVRRITWNDDDDDVIDVLGLDSRIAWNDDDDDDDDDVIDVLVLDSSDLSSCSGSQLGSELTSLAGSELGSELGLASYRPPMLVMTDFASWQQHIRLYCRGPFQMGTLRETLTEGTEGAAGYGRALNRVGYANPGQARVDKQPVQYLALNVNNVFKADDCDAFDSDVDEASTTQTMFMANLSSVDPVYDKAGPSCDSDVLSEVHDLDHYQDAVCKHHEVHNMYDDVQLNYVVDSYTGYTSDSNMIMYDQYSKVVDKSLTAELATYKEQLKLYERRARFELTKREQKIDEQLRIVIPDRNIKEENLKKELYSVKMQLASTINHNKSTVEEVTSLKKDFKEKENNTLKNFWT